MTKTKKAKAPAIQMIAVDEITPSYLNDQLYHRVDPKDPAIVSMAESMRAGGVHQPLTLTSEKFIASGHRRFAAAKLAGLKIVPCVVRPDLEHGSDEFMKILRECNMQRVKTFDERLREEVAAINTDDAYEYLKEYRSQKHAMVGFSSVGIDLGRKRTRSRISPAKYAFLRAVKEIVEENRENWPLSDRQIHYRLLNNPPLTHSSKPDSVYENTERCYKSMLIDLLTRARIAGHIPWAAIADETRPFAHWTIWKEPGIFIRERSDDYLKGYRRDFWASLPDYVCIIVEKDTAAGRIAPITREYDVPLHPLRGYSSTTFAAIIGEEWRDIQKPIYVYYVGDHDPSGRCIENSIRKELREFAGKDFYWQRLAVEPEHFDQFNFIPLKAKKSDKRYKKFVAQYGEKCAEVEAVPADRLRQMVEDAILLHVPAGEWDRLKDIESQERQSWRKVIGEMKGVA